MSHVGGDAHSGSTFKADLCWNSLKVASRFPWRFPCFVSGIGLKISVQWLQTGKKQRGVVVFLSAVLYTHHGGAAGWTAHACKEEALHLRKSVFAHSLDSVLFLQMHSGSVKATWFIQWDLGGWGGGGSVTSRQSEVLLLSTKLTYGSRGGRKVPSVGMLLEFHPAGTEWG